MRQLRSILQLNYPEIKKKIEKIDLNVAVIGKHHLVVNVLFLLATTALGIFLLNSQYMSPVSRWLISEGFHGHAWLAMGLLTVLLLLPSVGTCTTSIFGIVTFASVKGFAFSIVLLLLFDGDLLNRSNESAWYLLLITGIALLNSFSITPLIAYFALYLHLISVLPKRKDDLTYDRFSNSLSLYLGVTKDCSKNLILRVYFYLGKIRRSRIAILFLGKQLLSTNISRAYERRTEYFVQAVIESESPGSERTNRYIQKMLLSFEAEVALAKIALRSGSELDYKIMFVRGQFVFLVAAQALPLQPVGESVGIDVLKRILQLLARISARGNLSVKDKLHQLLGAIESSLATSNIFRIGSYASVEKDELDHIFVTAISSIFLERLGYLDHAWGLIENLDSTGIFNPNELFEDDRILSRGLALARVCTAMALTRSKEDKHHEEELHHRWASAIDIASKARDKNSWDRIIAAKPDLKNRAPSCERRQMIGSNDHAQIRFAFGLFPSHFGGGDYVSMFNIGAWLLIFCGLISYSIFSTYHADDFPLLTDPFRESKYSESETLSAVSLDSHIFIGTDNDGVHIIDTETYSISTEPSSIKSDGPAPGAITQMATANNSGDLIALISNKPNDNSYKQGEGIDLRDEDGSWSTIITSSSAGEISGMNLRDIIELNDAAIFLISDYLYGYDFATRELFKINTSLKEIRQIEFFNGRILVVSRGQLYEAELDGRTLYDEAIKFPSCFEEIDDLEIAASLDGFIVKTSTGAVLQSKEILGQWKVLFGGDQWISKDREAKNKLDVLDAGFDLTNRHMWLKLQSGLSIFFALKKEGDRFWSVSPSFTQEELVTDVHPVIDTEGHFIVVAKQNGVAILPVNAQEPWILKEEILLWEQSGVQTDDPWVPLSLDSNVEYGIVVTEKRNDITRVTAYSWDDLFQLTLGNTRLTPIEVAKSQPFQSNDPIIYVSDASDPSEVMLVQKKNAQTLIESTYNLIKRQPYGTDKQIFSLDKDNSIIDIGINDDSMVAIIANKDGRTGLANSGDSSEASDSNMMLFSPREPVVIRAGWDSGDGFEIVDNEGRSYQYSLSSGWVARNSHKIKPDSIQRRTDGTLVALTDDSKLVYHSEKLGWRELTVAKGKKYEKILPANRDTLLYSTEHNLSQLVKSSGEFELIDLTGSEEVQNQIALPVNDAIFIKIGANNHKLIISDRKGIIAYDFLAKDDKWIRYSVYEAPDYRFYSSGEGALAWSKLIGNLLEIKASIYPHRNRIILKSIFSGLKVEKLDVNTNGDYVAMIDNGAIFLNGLGTKLVSPRTDLSAAKATTATLVSGDIITISNGDVFKTDSNQIVSPFKVLPNNVNAIELASLNKTFIVLGNNRSIYCYDNQRSQIWTRIQNFKADVLIELGTSVLAIDNERNTAGIITSSFELVNLIYPRNESISGKEILDDAPAIEHNRQLYLASTYGVIAWRPYGKSKFLAFPRRDTVKEFTVVNEKLFVKGERRTYELIDGAFKTIFDNVAEKIVSIDYTEMILFKGGLWKKGSKTQPAIFGSTGASLGQVFDVLKFSDEDLLFIEEDGAFVKYGSSRQLIKETQPIGGLIVDADKLSEDTFYTVHRDINEFNDMKIVTWRWENHSPLQIQSKYITSFASPSNGSSLLKILTQNGDIYTWDLSTDRWQKSFDGFNSSSNQQVANFVPYKSIGAFVLSQNKNVWFYQPTRGSVGTFKIDGRPSKIKQIWPWGNGILALTNDNNLLKIDWLGKYRVIDAGVNLTSINDTSAIYLNETEDIVVFTQGSYYPSTVVKGRSNAAKTFFSGKTPTAMRAFSNSKDLLYVFDSKSLFRYDGLSGEWSKISKWNEAALKYKQIDNPSIEMVGNKLWIVHDNGLFNAATGKLYDSFGRPAVSEDSLVWIDAHSLAFVQDGVVINDREWENPKTNYVAWNSNSLKNNKVKMINVHGSKMYFFKTATVLFEKAGSTPLVYPPFNGTPASAADSFGIIGKEGIFVYGQNMRVAVFLFDGTSYEVHDPRFSGLKASRKRQGRHTFTDKDGMLYQFTIETNAIQGKPQLRLSKMTQQNTPSGIFHSAIFFESKFLRLAIDTKKRVWLLNLDKEPWQNLGILLFGHSMDDIRIFRSSEKIFLESIGGEGPQIYEVDVIDHELKFLTGKSFGDLDEGERLDLGIAEDSNDIPLRGIIDPDGWLSNMNSKVSIDPFGAGFVIDILNLFQENELYSEIDYVDSLPARDYSIVTGYLLAGNIEKNHDIELKTGRYRGAQLSALQCNSKGELGVQLKDGTKHEAFSTNHNGPFSKSPNTFKSNGNYSFKGTNIIRNIDGKKISLGNARSGHAFPTELIRKQPQSFLMTNKGTYYFDIDSNLWYLPLDKNRLLVSVKFDSSAELRFLDLNQRPCVKSNNSIYSLEGNTIYKEEVQRAKLQPLHKNIFGQTGDLKWVEDDAGKLKFSVQVTTSGIKKWIPVAIKDGGFEFDTPISMSRQRKTPNSTLGQVRALIRVNGNLYSMDIPSSPYDFIFHISDNNELIKDKTKIINAPFGRVNVSSSGVSYEIKTVEGKWDSLNILGETVFLCDFITDLLTNNDGTLHLECDNKWIVKQNKRDVLLSEKNYSGDPLEAQVPWPSNGLGTSPITRKPSGSGYQYKTMLTENIDVEWISEHGCFTIEALRESSINHFDEDIKANPLGGVCSLPTISGHITFDSMGRIVGSTSGGTSIESVSTLQNITVERRNHDGIHVTYRDINVLDRDKPADFSFKWQVENGKLAQNILKDVYMHENGSVSLLSYKKVRSYSPETTIVQDTYFEEDEGGIAFAHPRTSKNRTSVLKSTGNIYLKEPTWRRTDQSTWNKAKIKETDFSFSIDDEIDSLSFERGAKNYPVVKFSLPKLDDTNQFGTPVRINLSQNGFELDLPTQEACLLDGRLYQIKMGRVLKLDSLNSIARAKFGSFSSGLKLAYDNNGTAIIVNFDNKELLASSLSFKNHIVENTYMFAPYVDGGKEATFKFEHVSESETRIQWKQNGQENRVLMLESNGLFDHDKLTGVEYISAGKDNFLFLVTPNGASIRDANSRQLQTILPLEKINRGSRKIVSNSDGNTYIFSNGKYQEYNYFENTLSKVGTRQAVVQTGYKTSDWDMRWGPLGVLEFQNTKGTIQAPLQHGYLPGDRLLASSLIGSKDILLVTDAGLHRENRVNVYPIDIHGSARAESAQLRDHPQGALVQYGLAATEVPLLLKEQISTYQGSIDDRVDTGAGSIQITWGKKGLPPQFNYMSTIPHLPMSLTVEGGFESDYAESIDLVDEKPIAFLSDGIAICDAIPSETIYVKEGISKHALKTIQIFTDVHENGEYARLSSGAIVGIDYKKNGIEYSIPEEINNEELVSVASDGDRWRLTFDFKNNLTLRDYKYRDLIANEIFFKGQFSSDYVDSIWTDKEEKVWLKTKIAYEKWTGVTFDMHSTNLAEMPSAPTSFDHNTVSLVGGAPSYAIRELENNMPLRYAHKEPTLLEVGDSIWTISKGMGETDINWLRMFPNKWIEKRQTDQRN